jgi:hypothetical protein
MERGNHETLRLKTNIEDQLNRLLTQLQDLEENRDDFEPEEYEESRFDRELIRLDDSPIDKIQFNK